MALSPSLGQKAANLVIGGLIEIMVKLPNGVEPLRRLETNNLVYLTPQVLAGAVSSDRHSHDDASSNRRQSPCRGTHTRSGSKAVVNQEDRAPLHGNWRPAPTVRRLPPLDLQPLPGGCSVDSLLPDSVRADNVRLNNHDTSAGYRTHRQLLLAGNTQLAHNENVEGQM